MANYQAEFPILISPRPLRFGSDVTNPLVVARMAIGDTLREHRAELDGVLGVVAQSSFHLRTLLDTAAPVAEAEGVLALIRVVEAKLSECLQKHDVQVENLTHQAWHESMRTSARVVGHQLNPTLEHPRVMHCVEPLVSRHTKIIGQAQVILEAPPHCDQLKSPAPNESES